MSKNKIPRTALASGRGKSEENLKANYKSNYTRKYDLEIIKKISRQDQTGLVSRLALRVARSMERERRNGGAI